MNKSIIPSGYSFADRKRIFGPGLEGKERHKAQVRYKKAQKAQARANRRPHIKAKTAHAKSKKRGGGQER